MRRAVLGVFVLLAACGGDVRSAGDAVNRAAPQSADQRMARTRFLMSSEAQALIASFAKSHSQDALDTCLNAWIEGVSSNGVERPFSKPDADGLQAFLGECLEDREPGDLRGVNVRAGTSADLRMTRVAEARRSSAE